MNFIGVLSGLSLLLATAVTQDPKPCVSPPLMSGGITVATADGQISTTGTVSYDSFGQRMRVRNYGIAAGNHTFAVDRLMLYSQDIYYEIDWSRFSCTKKYLNSSFVPMQVPSDAKLMAQVFMGSSSSWGMGVLINNWYGNLYPNGFYTTVFSEIGCIPMTYTAYLPASGWITISTFNWVVGNSDPMDYIPPYFCAKAKLVETDKPDNVFTILESLAKQTKKVV